VVDEVIIAVGSTTEPQRPREEGGLGRVPMAFDD
jgi:hypothetical protein